MESSSYNSSEEEEEEYEYEYDSEYDSEYDDSESESSNDKEVASIQPIVVAQSLSTLPSHSSFHFLKLIHRNNLWFILYGIHIKAYEIITSTLISISFLISF